MAYDFEFEVAVGETKTFDLSSASFGASINNISYVGDASTYVTCVANTSDNSKLDATGIAQGVAVVNVSAGRLSLSIQITVASADDEEYLNKRGLTHFWENIDDIKQNKLTAGAGILITNDVISATGGGTADAVDWGHITGSMSNQTDLTTALAAKANSADLATVATSGDYDDLTDKPTIGNATLTIQKNGTSAGTFTANATSNKTINITVPTDADDVGALPDTTKYGASISVSVNTTDYKVTTTLKDQDGNTLGTAQVIDLPLESVVVNGSYDSTNKKIVLTLQNGNTIDIPVADLIAGLQTEITSTNMLASDLVDDTNQTHKFVTAAQITKLNGIASGAEVNVQSDWNVTSTSSDAFIKNKPTIPTKTSQLTNDSGYLTSYTETDPVFSASPAAEITSSDISAWDAKSDFSGDYADLTNKPTIGTGLLTLKNNNVVIGTFSANSTSGNTITVTTPTKTSDLTNDSGFLTSYTETDPIYSASPAAGITATDISNWNAKSDFSGSYNDLTNKPTIGNATLTIQKNGTTVQTFTANATSGKTANITVPTKTSELTNDSGFLDSVAWGDVTGKPTFATVATSGSYNDLTNKPTIPAAITVDSALSDSSTNPVENQVITNALGTKANASDVSTALAGKQNTLTAGDHINITGSTIKAVDYVHSDDPVSAQSVTQTVTNNMIATGTITADKFATGATLKLTMSTSDIGEGAALAANTLYGVYE